jgi:SAM-dependent methyltransferase
MLDWKRYTVGEYSFVEYGPAMRVVDVGCGRGTELQELQRSGCVAVGIEPDWQSLVSCRQRGLRVVQACAEHLPVRSACLDGLVGKTVIPYTDERRALGEIGRVLKPGAVARLCSHGAGYYARHLLAGPSWRFRFYGFRTLLGTWLYALTGRRLPGYLGDTIYQSRRRLVSYYRENGLRQLRDYASKTFLGLPVFIYHVVQKGDDRDGRRGSGRPARATPSSVAGEMAATKVQDVNGLGEPLTKAVRSLRWLPQYGWQRLVRQPPAVKPVHLLIAVADHFEPSISPESPWRFAHRDDQERRLERWCREYPKLAGPWRDADGQPFRHTYFYPAEQYDKVLLDRLAEHCRAGWGEVEIHLHHGVEAPDSAENTRRILTEFRDSLAGHGCLSRMDGLGPPRYAFVHGNWALANSAGGRCCGVDREMEILAETGCYADLTLPAAPTPAQVAKINALYECALPLSRRAPHRRGRDLRQGRPARKFPLIIQGPLMLNFSRPGRRRWMPCIENGALTTAYPPTLDRLRLWRQAAITVRGRPDWIFIKLHCHGMDPRDEAAMLGEPMSAFLHQLTAGARANNDDQVHFVTAREMTNIVLAACDGRDGNPGAFRDYRLRLIR